MPSFDVIVVGSGGGPCETNLTSFLVKCHGTTWRDEMIALDAGSGLGALDMILRRSPNLFGSLNDVPGAPILTATQVYSNVRAFLITHAHLDHVLGLVLLAGSLPIRQRLMGSQTALNDLESIFQPSRIWPNLATWNPERTDYRYLYEAISSDGYYKPIVRDIAARIMPLSHGSSPAPYYSSAYFIRNTKTMHEFLFFGDLEPDSVARDPLTIHVWRAAAPLIPQRLHTIFIECSWPSGRDNTMLFGHLTPEHLTQELKNLAAEVVRSRASTSSQGWTRSGLSIRRSNRDQELVGALQGLRVYIMHCKEDLQHKYPEPIHRVITSRVQELVRESGLGAEILHADQGLHIVI